MNLALATLEPTITQDEAARCAWEVVVIGAGPAGSVAARQLAKAGVSVLLVDRLAHPRPKVCGCCLNGAALAALRAIGLARILQQPEVGRLQTLAISTGNVRVRIPLPEGRAISREVLDTWLVQAAIDEGVEYLPRTRATVNAGVAQGREVALAGPKAQVTARARVVLVADGLAGQSLGRLPQFRPSIARHSRIGVSAILKCPPEAFRRDTIYMAYGRGGYVGLVCLEDGRLDLAAALDRSQIQRDGSPGKLIQRILAQSQLPISATLSEAAWRGTSALSRRRARLADPHLFVLGDAAGYVEPFTGEGMAWAIGSACLVTPLVQEAIVNWDPALVRRWTKLHRRVLGRRQRICRGLTWLLRHPPLARAAVRLVERLPGLASPVVRQINRPLQLSSHS